MNIRLILLGVVLSTTQCTTAQEIDETYVTHIVKTLSTDQMLGRETFTPGADMAADFLGEEFEKIGIDKLPGLDTYKQEFEMYSLSRISMNIKLDGTEYSLNQAFATVDQEKVSWTSVEDVKVMTVSASDDLRDVYGETNSFDGDVLILVHTSHEGLFNRYKQYYDRGSNKFELDKEQDVVVVLTDELDVENIEIDITSNVETLSLANIAGVIPGNRSDEIVLFSGHYDHIGYQEAVEGDSIANGANDDASGVGAVMALAKYFNGGSKPERTLYFVAFTAEEMGGFGSKYFSKQLNPDQIVAMFNIEMIGKPAVDGPNSAWITGFDKSDFGSLLQKSVEGTVYKFYADPYPDQNLFYRSDNATLARLGVPAHSISTTPIDVDKDYHQVSDEIETLDMPHLTNTVKAIAKAAEGMVSGELTPTRVDKSTID